MAGIVLNSRVKAANEGIEDNSFHFGVRREVSSDLPFIPRFTRQKLARICVILELLRPWVPSKLTTKAIADVAKVANSCRPMTDLGGTDTI